MVLRALEAFDIKKHARWPKGHPSAGKFRPMPDLLKKALRDFDGEGHPFDSFSRDQLVRAAKAMDISLSRGESRDSIAGKVFAKLDPKGNFRHDLDEIQAKQKPSARRQSGSRTAAEMIEDPEPEDRGRLTELLSGMTLPQIKEFAAEHDTKVMPFGTKADKVAGLVETLVGMRINLLAHGLGTKSDGSPDDFVPPWKKASVSSPADAVRQRELRTAELQKGGGLEGAGATDRLASVFHENWRASRAQPDGGFEPRVKTTKDAKWKAKHGTDQVDIANTPFEDLPEDWQAENRAAAKVVVDLMRTRGGNLSREEAGAAIHDAWLERNDWARGGDLDVPFGKLPKDEQDKDVEQYDAAVKLFGSGGGIQPKSTGKGGALETSAVSTGEIRQRVDTAFDELADPGREWVSLADLRKKLGGTREDQDKVLLNLVKVGQIRLLPEENRKMLSPEDRAAALNLSGEDKHLLGIVENGQMRRGGSGGGSVPAARAASASGDVRGAVGDLADKPGGWVRLSELRKQLAAKGYTAPEQDAALKELANSGGAQFIPVANLKSLSPEDRQGAVKVGGELKHLIKIDGVGGSKKLADMEGTKPARVRAPKAAAGASTGRAALKVAAADAIASPTGPMPADDVLNTMTIKQLKDFHEQRTGSKLSGVTRKADIIAAVKAR